MERIGLGKSGIEVSRIGIGAWQAGGKQWGKDVRDEDCIAAIVKAHELGVNLIDTAEVYGKGHSEEVVGRALKQIDRNDMVVATKVKGEHLGHGEIIKACEMSLKRLDIDAIDLYQIHWPSVFDQVPLRETMKAMEKLYKNGKIRAIGVSNFAVRDLVEAREALSHIDISSNQVQYSMIHRRIEKEVLPYCRKEGITVLAWAPLAEGALSGRYSESNTPRDAVRESHVFFKPKNIAAINGIVALLREIGSRASKTPVQVALNWLAVKRGVVPIPGAKTPKQMEENAGGVGWRLALKDLRRLDKALKTLNIEVLQVS